MKKVEMIRGSDLLKHIEDKTAEMQRKVEENGGMCVNCGKNPVEKDSTLSRFHCRKCNDKTREIVAKLQGTPGFTQINF